MYDVIILQKAGKRAIIKYGLLVIVTTYLIFHHTLD